MSAHTRAIDIKDAKVRQVAFFVGQREGTHLSKNIHTEQMKQRIDSAEGRAKYGRRFATAEPVFVNLRHNKQLNRLRAAQPSQGGRAVEALRLGAQHREAGAPRVCAKRQARRLTKERCNGLMEVPKTAADRDKKHQSEMKKLFRNSGQFAAFRMNRVVIETDNKKLTSGWSKTRLSTASTFELSGRQRQVARLEAERMYPVLS